MEKEHLKSNKIDTSLINNNNSKDKKLYPVLEILNKHMISLQSLINKNKNIIINIDEKLYQCVEELFNNIFGNIKVLNSHIIQYNSSLVYQEQETKNIYSTLFKELLNKEILVNNINVLSKKEKALDLIKEKTGIIVSDGKLINTNRKNNEIIILRTENSNLKGAIEQYEKKLLQKENEITKLNLSFEKDKSELLLKIKILNEELKRKKCTNYFRFKMTKKKINNNLKKSNDISRTLSNDSNELINNNHLTLNLLRTSDNSNILNYSGRTKIRDDKLNTLFFEKINTINHSHKNSYNCNKKIQEKFKSSYRDNNNIIIKVNESYNIMNNNNLNKTTLDMIKKLEKKKNTNKLMNENIYKKILEKNIDINYTKVTKTKAKSKEKNAQNNDINNNLYKNNKQMNFKINNNKPNKKIIHKKTISHKINSIPNNYNINHKNFENFDINNNNKENNKNYINLMDLKNLILRKSNLNKMNKININHRNTISNSISNYNSINDAKNLNSNPNTRKKFDSFNMTKDKNPTNIENI